MTKGNVLIIIAQNGFQPIEYKDTRSEIENKDYLVDVASITDEMAIGSDNSQVKPDLAVKDADLNKYVAVVIIGGPGAPALGDYEEVLSLIKEAKNNDKVLAAICIAPTILAKTGVLEGKKATVWNGDGKQGDVLKNEGAEFIDESVVRDGNIITGNGPFAAKDFGKKIIEALLE